MGTPKKRPRLKISKRRPATSEYDGESDYISDNQIRNPSDLNGERKINNRK